MDIAGNLTQAEIDEACEVIAQIAQNRMPRGCELAVQYWAPVYRVKKYRSEWRVICTRDWEIVAILKRNENTYKRARKSYQDWLSLRG